MEMTKVMESVQKNMTEIIEWMEREVLGTKTQEGKGEHRWRKKKPAATYAPGSRVLSLVLQPEWFTSSARR